MSPLDDAVDSPVDQRSVLSQVALIDRLVTRGSQLLNLLSESFVLILEVDQVFSHLLGILKGTVIWSTDGIGDRSCRLLFFEQADIVLDDGVGPLMDHFHVDAQIGVVLV